MIRLITVLLASTALLSGQLGAESSPPKIMNVDTLNINNWTITLASRGVFVEPFGASGGLGGLWNGPYRYIAGAGLWFAAIDSGGRKLIARGYDCGPGGSEFGPVNPYTEDWTNYQSDSLARVYLSTDPVDTAQWPLRVGGEPVILSLQDSYCKYSDQNPAFFWGPYPVNIVVEQLSYAWDTGINNDIVYYRFKVKNKNDYQLDSCFIGVGFDSDIGNESGASGNDRTTFDWIRNLAVQFQNVTEPGWPVTGVVGVRLLETPENNMGYAVNITDDQYPHTIQPGDPLGMTSFTIQDMNHSPTSEEDCYDAMAGYAFLDSTLDAYDQWGSESPGDKSFISAAGPFNLNAYDSVMLSIAVMAAEDTIVIKILSDSAQIFYDAYIGVGGTPTSVLSPLLLAQNLPNPFRQQTTISYQLTRPGLVSLRIYNVAGQMVRTLASSAMPAGSYSATWDGRDESGRRVSAGVYLYQLRANDRALTRKMVLLR